MNLGVSGSRPPSARRPHSRINPITGVETSCAERPSSRTSTRDHYTTTSTDSRPQSRPGSRPDGVPALNLRPITGMDDISRAPVEIDPYKYSLKSPGTATTVSWGTPTSVKNRFEEESITCRGTSRRSNRGPPPPGMEPLQIGGSSRKEQQPRRKPQPKMPTAWDAPPCPEDLPPPSQRFQQKYKDYENDMKESYRKKGTVSEADIEAKMAEMRFEYDDGSQDTDHPRDQLQKEWTSKPYTKAHSLKKMDVEELEMIKKRNKLIETVMMDQLSRAVISDPEQDTIYSGRKSQVHRPGMKRGAVRTLHDSKVSTSGRATEKMLSRRVRFGARILSRNGRDAVREIMGFFFDVDNSITIYEYKLFGKTAKALPFIQRNRYWAISGHRKDQIYELPDIVVGGTLFFHTEGQPLPDAIKRHPVVAFRVTEVDDQAKEEILLEDVEPEMRVEVMERLHAPVSSEEERYLDLLSKVQGVVQKQLRKRGVKVLTGLSRLFRRYDTSGDGQLNKYELEKALMEYRIDLEQDMFDDLWGLLDTDNSGYLDYGEFKRGFIGEMSEPRKELVIKAFKKIDTTRKGHISLGDMAKFYKANKHPKVISGIMDEREVTRSFLESFEDGIMKDHVTFEEFEDYYEGLGLGVRDDEEFANILRNAWSV